MCSAESARKFFNEHSQIWDDEINMGQIKRLKEIFSEKLSFVKPPFLDLGSGTGVLVPILKKYGNYSRDIFELDIAYKMLHKAREKYKSEHLHYLLADAHKLPLCKNYFNTVLCFQVYPHFNNKYEVTREIYRTLKNGGRLIVLHLMGHRELNELHRRAGREVAEDRILAAQKLAEMIASAGFNIQHTEEKEDIYLIIAQKI